jgi:hypothetical protein
MTMASEDRNIRRAIRRAQAIAEGSLAIWTGRGRFVPSGKAYKRKPKHTHKEAE